MRVTLLPLHEEQHASSSKLIWILPNDIRATKGRHPHLESELFNVPFYKEAYWRLCCHNLLDQRYEVSEMELLLFSTRLKIEGITGKILIKEVSKTLVEKSFGPASFSGSGAKFNVQISQSVSVTDPCNLQLCLEINCPSQHYLTLKSPPCPDFNTLLFSNDFSDVVVEAEGQIIPAHKNILSARSSVFMAMFQSGMKEEQTCHVKITDISLEVLREMLRYAYTGQVGDMESHAVDLIIAADKYNMRELCVLCREWLMKFDVELAPEVLIAADGISDDILKTAATDFIAWNLPIVMKGSHWSTLTKNHPHLVDFVFDKICQFKYK